MPTIYLEGYDRMNRLALRAYPENPKVIFNSVSFYANDAFKFWAAYYSEKGTILTGMQNGGHYGTGLWSSTEKHQIMIYDRFYTWGWKSPLSSNTMPLPAAQLNKVRNRIHPKRGGRLLLVQGAVPRYSYYMHSVSVSSSGYLKYLDEQYLFVKTLTKENRDLLTVRLYPLKYGWSEKERWQNEFPGIECVTEEKPLIDHFNQCVLFIGTYNATTFLETFVANFPSILFWNLEHWEIRSTARPFFDMLHDCGILHYNPGSAAIKVNEIAHDPIAWWHQPQIQAARKRYCHEYANTIDDWHNQWHLEMLSLKKFFPNIPKAA